MRSAEDTGQSRPDPDAEPAVFVQAGFADLMKQARRLKRSVGSRKAADAVGKRGGPVAMRRPCARSREASGSRATRTRGSRRGATSRSAGGGSSGDPDSDESGPAGGRRYPDLTGAAP